MRPNIEIDGKARSIKSVKFNEDGTSEISFDMSFIVNEEEVMRPAFVTGETDYVLQLISNNAVEIQKPNTNKVYLYSFVDYECEEDDEYYGFYTKSYKLKNLVTGNVRWFGHSEYAVLYNQGVIENGIKPEAI